MKSTRGIVLHHINYSDTSIIAHLLTIDQGFQSYIVKGARKPKAKVKKAAFLPLHELNISYYPKKSDNGLGLISSAHISHQYSQITKDIIKSSLCFFIAELSYKSLKNEPQNQILYEFVASIAAKLDVATTEQLALVPQYYMVRIATFLGFFPEFITDGYLYFDLQEGSFIDYKPKHGAFLSENETKLLQDISKQEFSSLGMVIDYKTERHALLDKLCLFYQLHLENFGEIKSLEVLKAVFQIM